MEYNLTEKDSYRREVSVTVQWKDMEGSFERNVSRFRQKIHLPGFRKGKVPRKVIFQKFTPEIEADFAHEAVQEYYQKILKENNISPISQATIEELSFKAGEPLEFKASFEVEPEVELFNYQKKFKVKKSLYITDEEDVNQYIEDLRSQFAELKPIETGSVEGHLLRVDIQEQDSTGIPIIGRKVEDRYVKIGDGIFGGDNLNRLIGCKSGDEVIVEDSGEDGKNPKKYGLTIKDVQEEILPELNEDFFKKVDRSASNEVELRENIKHRIEARLERDSETQLRESIIDHFIQNTTIEVPDSMVENYIQNALDEARSNNGESLDEKRFREEIRSSTIRNLKWYLIRKKIIKSEQIAVSDEAVDDKIKQIGKDSDEDNSSILRFYRKPSNREHLRGDILEEKLFDHLKLFVKVDPVKIHTKDLRRK